MSVGPLTEPTEMRVTVVLTATPGAQMDTPAAAAGVITGVFRKCLPAEFHDRVRLEFYEGSRLLQADLAGNVEEL